MEILIIIFAILWIICGILAYGFAFAYYQNEYPFIAEAEYNDYKIKAFIMALFGICGLVALICLNGCKHGLKYK